MAKKILAMMMAVILVFALVACGGGSTGGGNDSNDAAGGDEAALPRIGLMKLMDHTSLNTIEDSIIKGLADRGYVDGDTCIIEKQDGQGDMTVMKTIAQTFVANECDVIIAIATPAAQAVLSETTDIPLIFAAVTDPVGAGIVDDMSNPGGSASGTSDAISPADIMALAEEMTPGFKTIGALYSSGEDNSASVIADLKDFAAANGYEVLESTVTSTGEVQQAAQYLADKVDVVFSPIDNTVASAMAVASDVFNTARIPYYVSADSMVQDGALATYGIDYTILGDVTADMVSEIIEGADVSKMAVRTMDEMSVYVNQETADAIGLEIPQSVLDRATIF